MRTIDHLMSGCPILTKENKNQNDKFKQCIHWKMYQYYRMLQAEKLYENHHELVTEEQEVTILYHSY